MPAMQTYAYLFKYRLHLCAISDIMGWNHDTEMMRVLLEVIILLIGIFVMNLYSNNLDDLLTVSAFWDLSDRQTNIVICNIVIY